MLSTPYLESVIRPATKFQDAGLFVKGKIFDVNFTRGLVNGGRLPLDEPLVIDGGFRRQGYLEVAVRAETVINNHPKDTQRTAGGSCGGSVSNAFTWGGSQKLGANKTGKAERV